MKSSTSCANRDLDRVVSDGGSWWVTVSLALPVLVDGVWTGVISPADVARVELPRNGATSWAAAADRSVEPLVGRTLGPSATAYVPVARVFYDAATGGSVERVARLVDVSVPAGQPFTLPPSALALSA